ncbi:heavy-metal-associated domain-containing protein [Telluria aromaticivorans]|uniref:Heavy-metal-associated domain-containing protein n=1 Tax=Telluria aromaticivorans TaxID=2725995 RepID=A0A7Y2NY36_9BURK|nr:cation transporter [Telluria aromaticivorans]NNG21579.1 heavy-metal-associated domain-containing protein [Telluria aromaticivorans]
MYELQVEGMSCGGCARSVTKSVQAVDAGAKVEVDLASKKVRIDSQASLEMVKAAIGDAGYPVTASATV